MHERLFLNRSQGAQCCFFGLRQATDTRDLEALVGAIASQRAEMIAGLHSPQHDGSVISATGQPGPIRTYLQRPDRPLMRLVHPPALAAAHIPPAQRAITASADER